MRRRYLLRGRLDGLHELQRGRLPDHHGCHDVPELCSGPVLIDVGPVDVGVHALRGRCLPVDDGRGGVVDLCAVRCRYLLGGDRRCRVYDVW